MIVCRQLNCFKIKFSEKTDCIQIRLDLDPDCLQNLLAENATPSSQRVNMSRKTYVCTQPCKFMRHKSRMSMYDQEQNDQHHACPIIFITISEVFFL